MRAATIFFFSAAIATIQCRAVAFAPEHTATPQASVPRSSPAARSHRAGGGTSIFRAELRSSAGGGDPGGGGGDDGSTTGSGGGAVIGRSASGAPLLEALGKTLAKVRPSSTLRAVFGAVPSFWYWIRSSKRGGDGGEEGEGSKGPIGHHHFVDAMHSAKTYRLCVLYVLGYLALSVGAYSFFFERWPIVDALYFAVTCFTSVGYGDLCPETRAAKIFTTFFALYGISILGIALGVVGSQLVEAEEKAVERAGERAKRRLMRVFRNRVNAKGMSGTENHREHPSTFSSIADLVLTQLPNLALIAALALWIGHREGWSILTSLYYCVITTTTVGLGDVSPSSRFTRLLAVVFIPLSVAVLGELLGRVAGFFMDREVERAEREFLGREMTEEDLALMDADENGDVDLAEFMTFMLVTMGKVDRETMDEMREVFESLDVERNGVLNKKDLEALALRKSNAAGGSST